MGRVGTVAWVCTAVLAVTGCSSGDDPPGSASTGTAGDAAESSTDPSAGASSASGVETTAPGSALELGDRATVAWRPTAGVEGVIELRVDAVREARTADFAGLVAPGAVEGARPYYVDVTVTNVGHADLGGLAVPLYLQDTSGTLGPPWGFEEPFAPCRSRPLPEHFGPGDATGTCLVFFARAGSTYDAMAFAPNADQEAITWTGEAAEAARGRPSRRGR
jgi:hypothetical protein